MPIAIQRFNTWSTLTKAVLALTLAGIAGAAWATIMQEPALPEGMKFIKAREAILAAGWLPLQTREAGESFTEGKWHIVVPELVDCPSASFECSFAYVKEKRCLVVRVSDRRLTKAEVTKITRECPQSGGVPVVHAEPIVQQKKTKADPWEPEEDMSFIQARKQILAHGWKPVNEASKREPGTEYESLERQVLARGWREMSFCYPTGLSMCTFFYTKKNECMTVTTTGEQIRDLELYQWSDDCSLMK